MELATHTPFVPQGVPPVPPVPSVFKPFEIDGSESCTTSSSKGAMGVEPQLRCLKPEGTSGFWH